MLTLTTDILRHLWKEILLGVFHDRPQPKQVMLAAVALAFFWALAFKIMTGIMKHFIRDEPGWLIRAAGESNIACVDLARHKKLPLPQRYSTLA